MIDLAQIRQAPVTERIHLIELILQSLKQDMSLTLAREITHDFTHDKPALAPKPFKVRVFDLGQELAVDRDMIYAERGRL